MSSGHDYTTDAAEYAKLEFEGTYFLAFRDVPSLLQKHAHGNRALDYGCGAGRSTRFLKRVGFEVTGVDISAEMLSEARSQDPSGDYRQIQSASLPFEDASFDVVFSSFVFLEVATLNEIAEILTEMNRVLEPDGVVVVVGGAADGFPMDGNWTSFTYDFPENRKELKSGDTVKLAVKGTDIAFHDFFWKGEDYDLTAQRAGLVQREVHSPLGRDDDGIAWLDETSIPVLSVYIYARV